MQLQQSKRIEVAQNNYLWLSTKNKPNFKHLTLKEEILLKEALNRVS